MANFEDFLYVIRSGLKPIVAELGEQENQLIPASEAFLKDCEYDLTSWANDWSRGQLNRDDIEFLLSGKRVFMDIHLHGQSHLSTEALDQFKASFQKLILDSATSTLT